MGFINLYSLEHFGDDIARMVLKYKGLLMSYIQRIETLTLSMTSYHGTF